MYSQYHIVFAAVSAVIFQLSMGFYIPPTFATATSSGLAFRQVPTASGSTSTSTSTSTSLLQVRQTDSGCRPSTQCYVEYEVKTPGWTAGPARLWLMSKDCQSSVGGYGPDARNLSFTSTGQVALDVKYTTDDQCPTITVHGTDEKVDMKLYKKELPDSAGVAGYKHWIWNGYVNC